MDLNFIIFMVLLCFTIGVGIHILVERGKNKRHREQIAKDKKKRIKDTLKRLDWQQKA